MRGISTVAVIDAWTNRMANAGEATLLSRPLLSQPLIAVPCIA